MGKKHSLSLSVLEDVLNQNNIVIDKIHSIAIDEVKTEGYMLPLGKYSQINITVFVPICE